MSDVPDPRLDARVEAGEDPAEVDRSARAEMASWLAGRGFEMEVRTREAAVGLPRWIGVVPLPGLWQSHCMVFARDRLLFDPSLDWYRRQERLLSPFVAFGDAVVDVLDPPRVRAWSLVDVGFGLCFCAIDEKG